MILESNRWIRWLCEGDGSIFSFSYRILACRPHFTGWATKIIGQFAAKRPTCQFQQAFPLRHSFNKLCVAQISDHSLRQASNPRRMKPSKPRTSLICPNTGSTVRLRHLYSFLPRLVRSFRSINSVADRPNGIRPRGGRSCRAFRCFQSFCVATNNSAPPAGTFLKLSSLL